MPSDACGIPNRANWYTHVVFGREDETTYTDIYTCDEHFPGYPDGSMSEAELRTLVGWTDSDLWDVLEFHSTRLR